MTARKTVGGRKKAGRKAGSTRAAGKQSGRSKRTRKKAARKKKSARTRASGGASRGGHSTARGPSRLASLADRLTQLIEHMAAETVRRVVDSGGREIGAWLPEASEMRLEAGAYLRELRELAGLTLDELSDAAELSDRSLLEAVEEGTSTLSFELILRLAAILARHDPVPFISRMVRTYNPVLWQLLEDWGIGRLPLQLAREREFVNILRGHDLARELPDEDFERVLDFTRSAFETALHFAQPSASSDSS